MADSIREYDLKTLLDASPVIVTVIDPRSYVALYQNATGEGFLGNIKGKICYQNIPGLETRCAFCKMQEAIETGELQTTEVEHPSLGWLRVQFAPVDREDGTIDIVETITDINAQKTKEQEFDD
ncbi:MAG: PAS domain-containing protein, partial [Myxococcota bacterium]|nr:PAS domain-containing protein [Myxococcota bacterium]